jgi:hypothetical protein
MQIISWSTMVVLAFLGTSVPAAPAPAPPEIQVLERTDLPGGLVREKLRLTGFDPDEAVPNLRMPAPLRRARGIYRFGATLMPTLGSPSVPVMA